MVAEFSGKKTGRNQLRNRNTSDEMAAAKNIYDALVADQDQKRRMQLMQALLRLSLDTPEKNAEVGFSRLELAEKMDDLFGTRWGETHGDEAVKALNKPWKDLVTTAWPSKLEGIRDRCRQAGLPVYPRPDKEKGGGSGNLSTFRVILEPITEDDARPSLLPCSRVVHYVLDERYGAPAVFQIQGGRKWAMIAGIAVTAVIAILFLLTLVATLLHASSAGAGLVLLASLALIGATVLVPLLSVFVRLPNRCIAPVPTWMVRS